MKKTFYLAIVFFICGALFLPACAKNNGQKIRPGADYGKRIENNTVIERPETGGSAQEGKVGPDPSFEKQEKTGKEIIAEPKIIITESYILNPDKEWTAVYGKGEVLDALNAMDMRVATVGTIEVTQRNGNDCATTISVGGRIMSAYDFKEALGLRSTMITEIKREGAEYIFTGKGEN